MPLTTLRPIADERREILVALTTKLWRSARSNKKLGQTYSFSLPSQETCPGKTTLCASVCYADETVGSVHFRGHDASTQTSYRQNLAWTMRPDWTRILARSLESIPTGILRLHVAGDFYSPQYAESWFGALAANQHIRAFAFTKSWRVPEMLPRLEELRRLDNCRLFASTDAETEALGEAPPEGWPVARMSNVWKHQAKRALKRKKAGKTVPAGELDLDTVCPQQLNSSVSCDTCGLCPGVRLRQGRFEDAFLTPGRAAEVTFLLHK